MRVLTALALLSPLAGADALSAAPRGWSLVSDAPADMLVDLTFMLTLPKEKVNRRRH
jgi:hypothetical protein